MDSASEPPSLMAAAASNKRKFRTCLRCPSRMPSIDFDSHTLCIKCRNQVCDLDVHCDECRDWPVSKRKVFVKYNRGLKARRDSKRKHKARLSGTAHSSDQSVYDTDTDVPLLDEPSVPVQSVDLESVVSQESVVSESGGLSEAGPSEVLYVSSGDGLEKLATSLFSKFSEFQSDRGRPPPPVQSHSFVGSVNQPVVADTKILGVFAPPQGVYLPNPVNPVFRLPTAPVSDETPYHRLVASDRRVQELERAVAATCQTISVVCDGGIRPPQSLLDSASSLSRDLEDAKQSSSVSRGESRPPSSQPGVSSSSKRFAATMPVQPGPSHPEGDPASAGPSRRRSYDSPPGSLGILLARGVILLPGRGVGSRTIRLPMRVNCLQLADNGTISRMTRTIFVLLLWRFYWTTS